MARCVKMAFGWCVGTAVMAPLSLRVPTWPRLLWRALEKVCVVLTHSVNLSRLTAVVVVVTFLTEGRRGVQGFSGVRTGVAAVSACLYWRRGGFLALPDWVLLRWWPAGVVDGGGLVGRYGVVFVVLGGKWGLPVTLPLVVVRMSQRSEKPCKHSCRLKPGCGHPCYRRAGGVFEM